VNRNKKSRIRTKEGWGNECLREALTILKTRGDRKDLEKEVNRVEVTNRKADSQKLLGF